MWIQKIVPIPDQYRDKLAAGKHLVNPETARVEWPTLDRAHALNIHRNVAPGERDSIRAEFVIASYSRLVRVYSFIEEDSRRSWKTVTIHDLGEIQ